MQKQSAPVYSLEIEAALVAFESTRHGLSSQQAEQRQQQFGPNVLPSHKPSLLKRLIEPFASAFVGMLIVALVLSLFEHKPIDALIIGIIIGANALIYYAQQRSVSKVLRTLRAHDVAFVPVIRDGQTIELPSEQLTLGDVIHLHEGMKVPADGRIIDASQLECEEAVLTGESTPVRKHAGAITGDQLPAFAQENMAFKGTYVGAGSGLLLVTAIGIDTQLGTITSLASHADMDKSPIEQKIDSLVRRLIAIIGVVAAITLLLALYRGVAFDEALRFAIAIMVSAVPEGLPVALTIVLLLSARRMARAHALVKKMSSIETMGAITLIATDKTGTLTKNKLSVADKHTTHPTMATFDQVIRASLNNQGDHMVDSMDRILLSSVANAHLPESWTKVRDFPFNQDLRVSATLWHRGHDGYLLIVKGAPEHILDRCLLRHRNDAKVTAALQTFTSNGYRTIAFAHKIIPQPIEQLEHHDLHDLGFDGFVGMIDSMRPEVATAVAEAQRAGIKVIMLTGDHVATAGFIARQVGIATNENQVVNSTLLKAENPDDIREKLRTVRVFGRVLPEHKYALLKAIKGHEITAMTGDGVNDIPALVEADAGIAMGSGSDAAKDASDIVLLDDNFRSIVSAIRVGRTALANIRKMLVYLLSTSLGEVLTMLLALLLNVPLPVAAVQILWINLVTDGVSVIPLGLSPAEPRQMLAKPRLPSAPLLNTRQLTRILLTGITMSVSILAVYNMNLPKGHLYAQTLAFLGLIVVQWTSALNTNFEYRSSIYNIIRPNVKLLVAIGVSIILQVVVFLTPAGKFLGVVETTPIDAIAAMAIPSLAVLGVVEAHKFTYHLYRRRRRASA